MNKLFIEILNLLAVGALFSLPFLKTKIGGIMALLTVSVQVAIASAVAVSVFLYGTFTYTYVGSTIIGTIPVRVDYLSAWFILTISFTFLTGAWYGFRYMKKYKEQQSNLGLHSVAYVLAYTALINICLVQNGFVLLIFWEIMAISAFILVIFEHYKTSTLKAGINYLIQSHISILLLTIGFMWVKVETGSFDFTSVSIFTSTNSGFISAGLFLFFFTGFAVKAGFVPFHTWLPLAHPAAPSHVSGVMSGVIIKIGIYGIFRVLGLIPQNMLALGIFVIAVSLLSAVFGIANAAVKLDFKRMLAYCSIENIGIVGIGIGLGMIGLGTQNAMLAFLGFSGALIHMVNHSLFKSLLFFSAGNVYQQTRTRNIEKLGGLLKKMPVTGSFFLIGSLAIGGLPPFNGFVSEYLIYLGLFSGMSNFTGNAQVILLITTLAALAVVGGMSMLTFSKNFGVIFLGTPRQKLENEPTEVSIATNLPLVLIVLAMFSIALFPQFYLLQASKVIAGLFSVSYTANLPAVQSVMQNISLVGLLSFLFTAVVLVVFSIRYFLTRKSTAEAYETWGCGYVAPVPKAQYTGRSFVRQFSDLFGFMVKNQKKSTEIKNMKFYPAKGRFSSFYFDVFEKRGIDPMLRVMRSFLANFQFIQNGRMQMYVLYGLFFVLFILLGTFINYLYTMYLM